MKIRTRDSIVDKIDATKTLQKQLNGGASSLVLLALLNQNSRPMYGYEIARELERKNGAPLPMKAGALYPVLRSLEKQGLLSSKTELSDEGRARKYYKLTKTGSRTFAHWQKAWTDTKSFIDRILENKNDPASSRRNAEISKKTGKRASKSST